MTARKVKSSPRVDESPIQWTRADPAALAAFNPDSKACTMNCGKHAQDPRSYAEVRFLCNDCEPARKSVHQALAESLAREAALRAELDALRAVTRNA